MTLTLDAINRIADVVLAAQRIDPLTRDIRRHYDDAFGYLESARVNAAKGDAFRAMCCLVYAEEHRAFARALRRRRWS